MEISEKIECTFCSRMYEVLVHDDENEKVQFCSYCGEMIELSEEEDDNWDT
jgi:rRNA maturation endonuclease Nob1